MKLVSLVIALFLAIAVTTDASAIEPGVYCKYWNNGEGYTKYRAPNMHYFPKGFGQFEIYNYESYPINYAGWLVDPYGWKTPFIGPQYLAPTFHGQQSAGDNNPNHYAVYVFCAAPKVPDLYWAWSTYYFSCN